MIIWSGFGILVVPIIVVCALLAMIITSIVGPTDYGRLHGWPLGVGLLIAAVVCWVLGRQLRQWGSRILVDPHTGETVVVRRGRSLFFIPMEWWSIPVALIGLAMFSLHSTPEQLRQKDAEQAFKKEWKRQQRELNGAQR